jgi:cytochrome P450 family 142 subfamily A polypeptide 1
VPDARPDFDLLDGRFYAGECHPAYAWMRANEPVYRDERNGIWGAASYRAVLDAERDPKTFSNAGGIRPDNPALPMMIDMDDPAHKKRRMLVYRGFTPKRVAETEPEVRALCDDLIDAVCEQGECDFVRDLAAPLPMIVIGDMLGVAPEDRDDLLRWSDDMVSAQGGNVSAEMMDKAATAAFEYAEYALKVIAARRAQPTDDLMSALVHAEVDGERMNNDELIHESLLILVGGDETTRHVISGGMEQLLLDPGQHERLAADLSGVPLAVEEMLRWVTPIKNMCRTLTKDRTFYGSELKAGEKVMLLYEGANFDDTQFDDPERFDIARHPNDHVAFGFGAHYCLGQALARVELNAMFERLLTRIPDMKLGTDEPLPRRPANFISGLESMPVQFTPTAPLGARA